MKAQQIRQTFLEFFESKAHEVVPSAPMVIKDDPTLMFTNAGMNQFKDIFLGNKPAKSSRIADTQKCLRVSGKHNDLEEVGVDTYHHTMFEMLGNWSFGDYFKKEAIEWAWELLTDVYKINPENLYITIFEGDEKDGLEQDDEAREIWKALVSDDKILACSKKDNFWEMGETGPCGPCSEIHIDLRSNEDKSKVPGRTLVNADHPEVIEIWNLVFMEFNRQADGSLNPLPNKHIDTGMGFERLATVLQSKKSNYDTDVFSPLISRISALSGKTYSGSDSKTDVAIRVISDHVRAVAFSIADGQLPSNTGAGYVIRRILRRAIRYSYSFLDMNEPFIHELVAVLDEQMGSYFKELHGQKDLIQNVIREEEESFLRTLAKGISRLEDIVANTSGKVLDGKEVFELYDTYGFPVDLTALIAGEKGFTIDEVGFNSELETQKNRSRAVGKIEAGDWVVQAEDSVEEFVGYDLLETEIKITRFRNVKHKGKDQVQMVFNLTPFYPEGGGQVGDTGLIEAAGHKVRILNTVKENNLIIHVSEKLPSDPSVTFNAKVDSARRLTTERHHSVTHLLHHALRTTLGTHVEQKGSLVHPDYLRFDFSHFAKLSDEELAQVELQVNTMIQENLYLDEKRNIPLSEAKAAGAMMLFGEKYGDTVRLIQFGNSKELCGGTHVKATGNIGLFKIVSESAIAAGIRRIEAVAGHAALKLVNDRLEELKSIHYLLKNPQDSQKAVNELLEKNQALSKELEKFMKEKTSGLKLEMKKRIKQVNGVNFLAERVDLGPAEVKDLSFQLKGEVNSLFAVFGSESDGKAMLTCMVTEDLVSSKGLDAGKIIRELAKDIQGGGGGQAFFATAGGKDSGGLDKAIKNAVNFIS
jgi:alanyl-tRNA synthetase